MNEQYRSGEAKGSQLREQLSAALQEKKEQREKEKRKQHEERVRQAVIETYSEKTEPQVTETDEDTQFDEENVPLKDPKYRPVDADLAWLEKQGKRTAITSTENRTAKVKKEPEDIDGSKLHGGTLKLSKKQPVEVNDAETNDSAVTYDDLIKNQEDAFFNAARNQPTKEYLPADQTDLHADNEALLADKDRDYALDRLGNAPINPVDDLYQHVDARSKIAEEGRLDAVPDPTETNSSLVEENSPVSNEKIRGLRISDQVTLLREHTPQSLDEAERMDILTESLLTKCHDRLSREQRAELQRVHEAIRQYTGPVIDDLAVLRKLEKQVFSSIAEARMVITTVMQLENINIEAHEENREVGAEPLTNRGFKIMQRALRFIKKETKRNIDSQATEQTVDLADLHLEDKLEILDTKERPLTLSEFFEQLNEIEALGQTAAEAIKNTANTVSEKTETPEKVIDVSKEAVQPGNTIDQVVTYDDLIRRQEEALETLGREKIDERQDEQPAASDTPKKPAEETESSQSKPESTPQQTKQEVDGVDVLTAQLSRFNLSLEDMAKIPGFESLSIGKKRRVMEDFIQLNATDLKESSEDRYREETAKANWFSRNLIRSIAKPFFMRNVIEKTRTGIISGGLEKHQALLTGLIARQTKGPEVITNKETGKLETQFIDPTGTEDPDQARAIALFNRSAHALSDTPSAWARASRFSREGTLWKERQRAFETSKHFALNYLRTIMSEKAAAETVAHISRAVAQRQSINTDANIQQTLRDIDQPATWRAALKQSVRDKRGAVLLGGAATLIGSSLVSFVSAPIAAGGFVGYLAYKRKKEAQREERQLALRQGLNSTTLNTNTEETEKGAWNKVRDFFDTTPEDIVTAEAATEKLQTVIDRVKNAPDEKAVATAQVSLSARIDWAENNIDNDAIQYGEITDRLGKQFTLIETLNEAKTLRFLDTKDTRHQELKRRYDHFVAPHKQKTMIKEVGNPLTYGLGGFVAGMSGATLVNEVASYSKEWWAGDTTVRKPDRAWGTGTIQRMPSIDALPDALSSGGLSDEMADGAPPLPMTEVAATDAGITSGSDAVTDSFVSESAVEPNDAGVESTAGVENNFDIVKNDTVWSILETQLQTTDATSALNPVERTYVLDAAKDYLETYSNTELRSFGFTHTDIFGNIDINHIEPGDKIDLSVILDDLGFLEETKQAALELSPSDRAQIAANIGVKPNLVDTPNYNVGTP